MRINILLLLLLLSFTIGFGQSNLVPDPSFEGGDISGTNDEYYKVNWKTIWRAWPWIGFEFDSETKNTGNQSLKVAYRNYGNASFDPTFRLEEFPPVEDGTYTFSFYYKTDIDRSGEKFIIQISEGTELAGNVNFFTEEVPILSEAKDGFVQLKVEFTTGKAMDGIIPFIKVPFISEGAFFHLDDAAIVKVVDTPEAWGPSPENGATAIATSDLLRWQSGIGALKHNVYLGTSADALTLEVEGHTETFWSPQSLKNETTYFFRIDEVDESDVVTTGEVWSFTTKTYYEENMELIQNERVESGRTLTWKQFGPGNAGFVNFLRYHPLLPDFCLTSPDMRNTYQTEDNGENWKTVKDVDGEGDFNRLYDMFYSTKTPSFAIAIESSRLWTSNDTARSWQVVTDCPWYTQTDAEGNEGRSWYRKVSAVAIDPQDDDTWYVGEGNFARGQQHLWSSVSNATASNPRGSENTYDNIDYQGKIWKTSDAGSTWTELSNGLNALAQFSRIIVHPENKDIIFAASQYGLFKTTDGGANWSDIGTGKLDNNTIMNMDYYYNSSTHRFVLYVADQVRYLADGQSTKCTGGIFKSEDNGDTWTNINGNLYLDLNRLTGGVSGRYYNYLAKWFGITSSQAQSTYPVLPTAALQYFNSLNVDSSEEDALLVGFYDAQTGYSITPGRLWRTNNGGTSWLNIARDYAPAWQADKAYWDERNNPVTDNLPEGHQISNQQWGSNYPWRSLRYCAVNSRGDIMILYAHNTFVSTDKGETFKCVDETYTANGNIMGNGNSNLPGQCLYQDKRLGEGILYLGSGEHHLWKTTNDGTNGKQAAKYLNGSQESVFAVATHPWDEEIVYTTSMRQTDLDRIYRSTDGGESFVDWGKATEASEWMRTNHIRIDPVNPENMYFGVTEVAGSGGGSGTGGPDKDKPGGFHKSTNSGKSFTTSNSGMPEKVWVRDIEFDPRDDTRASLFVAAPWNKEVGIDGGLFHSSDRGLTWTEISVSSTIEGVNNVVFDHTGRMYVTAGRRAASAEQGGLFYSDDYGSTWNKIFEAEYVDNIDVSPFDHNIIVFSNGELAQNPGVFISFDRGLSWTKSNHTMGQPDKITQIEFDLHDPYIVWLSVMGSGFYKGMISDDKVIQNITVTPGNAAINVHETVQLNATSAVEFTQRLFKSDNPSVATVDEFGLVTGKGQGACKIWATSGDGRYSDFVHLVVSKVEATGMDISASSMMLYKGQDSLLTANVLPQNVSDTTFSWSSGNSTVATVDANGLVTALDKGTAIITASSTDGGYKATCTVTVDFGVGVEQVDALSISVFPNPTADNIKVAGIVNTENYAIYSVEGKELLTGTISPNQSINCNMLPKGIYLLKISGNKNLSFTKK